MGIPGAEHWHLLKDNPSLGCSQNLNNQMAKMNPKRGLLCTEIFCAPGTVGFPWISLPPLRCGTSQLLEAPAHFITGSTNIFLIHQHWVFSLSFFRGEMGKTTFCPKRFATKMAYFVEIIFLNSIYNPPRN